MKVERAFIRSTLYVFKTASAIAMVLTRVSQLALVQWKANFFIHVQNKHTKLASAILKLIELQRNGETIDQGLVKKVIDSFGMNLSCTLFVGVLITV